MTRWLFSVVALIAVAGCGGSSKDLCTADAELACPAAITQECTGALTSVPVGSPDICADHSLSSDAPADGYAVGDTTITFTNDTTQRSCTTSVTVTDSTAPTVTCEQTQTFVRTQPGPVQVSAGDVVASDSCSDQVDVAFSPSQVDANDTVVEFTATDAAGNSASCTTAARLVDLFPVLDLQLVSSELAGASTDVTLAWRLSSVGDATGYRVERADDPAGPWTALATTATNVQIFTDTLPGTSAYYRVVTVGDDTDGGVSNTVRGFAIAADLYDIRDVSVPGVPFDTTLYGVVRYPQDLSAGPFPFILVLHGNHGNCRPTPTGPADFCSTRQDHECASSGDFTTPNAEGYIYFLESLAAQGYVAVSISGNAMNCRNDYIIERSQLMIEHLRQWATWNTATSGPFGDRFVGSVDMTNVGLVGHSRGGDAAANVPAILDASPVAGVDVRSVFALAPTDYHDATVPDTELAVLLPGCDGDVVDLQGMHIYDRSIPLNDGSRRTQVLFVGANHNYFNTEWLSNDNAGFVCPSSEDVGRPAQMGMLEMVLGRWFRSSLAGDPVDSFMRADSETPGVLDIWAGLQLDLRWSYSSASRLIVDDLDGANVPDVNDLGQSNSFTGGFHSLTRSCVETGCSSRFLHDLGAMRLLWEAGNTPVARWGLGGLDASGHETMSFRVVSRFSSLNSDLDVQDFRIRISDTTGEVVDMLLSDYKTLYHQYPAYSPWGILQTVRIPIVDLVMRNPSLNVTSLDGLELEMTALDRSGSVTVTDFELAQ